MNFRSVDRRENDQKTDLDPGFPEQLPIQCGRQHLFVVSAARHLDRATILHRLFLSPFVRMEHSIF